MSTVDKQAGTGRQKKVSEMTLEEKREIIRRGEAQQARAIQAQRAHENSAAGGDAYLNRHNAAASHGWADSDRLQQNSDLSQTTFGKVVNQAGLSTAIGVYKTTPVQVANTGLHLFNDGSLSKGGDKVVPTAEDARDELDDTRKIYRANSAFTNDDGSPTPLGAAMSWVNEFFEAAPGVALDRLKAGRTYGEKKHYTGAAVASVLNSYFGRKHSLLRELNSASEEELLAWAPFNAQLGIEQRLARQEGEKLTRKELIQRSRNSLAEEAGIQAAAVDFVVSSGMKQFGKLTDEDKKRVGIAVAQQLGSKVMGKKIRVEIKNIVESEKYPVN